MFSLVLHHKRKWGREKKKVDRSYSLELVGKEEGEESERKKKKGISLKLVRGKKGKKEKEGKVRRMKKKEKVD